jgi:hypothetical protein
MASEIPSASARPLDVRVADRGVVTVGSWTFDVGGVVVIPPQTPALPRPSVPDVGPPQNVGSRCMGGCLTPMTVEPSETRRLGLLFPEDGGMRRVLLKCLSK